MLFPGEFDPNPMTPNPYLFIVIFMWRSAGLSFDPARPGLAVAANFSAAQTGSAKNATYECGVESIGEAQIQFRSQYYLYCDHFPDI